MGKEVLMFGDIEIEQKKITATKVLPISGTYILKKY